MFSITIEAREGNCVALSSPFHPTFPKPAKAAGGRWDGKAWIFDARDVDRARAICRDIFGADDQSDPDDVLTIRAPARTCDAHGHGKFDDRPMSYWLAGRKVAHATGRDSGAFLAPGVVVIQGSFTSGGSVKNPACRFEEGTVIEVRDVPRVAAERVHERFHGVTLLDRDGNVVREPTTADSPAPEAPEPSAAPSVGPSTEPSPSSSSTTEGEGQPQRVAEQGVAEQRAAAEAIPAIPARVFEVARAIAFVLPRSSSEHVAERTADFYGYTGPEARRVFVSAVEDFLERDGGR